MTLLPPLVDPTAQIHPSAHISDGASIGPGTTIGPGAVVEGGVTIGRENVLGPYVVIEEGTTIGDRNQFRVGAVIGGPPQDLAYNGEPSFTIIGDDNVFREHVTVHRGTKPGSKTTIGNHVFLMANAHVAHNCTVHDHVILVNNALLGGYVEIGERAFLSGNTSCHQFTRVGPLAILGGNSAINQDLPPFAAASGRKATFRGINLVGIRRGGFDAALRQAIQAAYRRIYRDGEQVKDVLPELLESEVQEVRDIAKFIETADRGIIRARSDEE